MVSRSSTLYDTYDTRHKKVIHQKYMAPFHYPLKTVGRSRGFCSYGLQGCLVARLPIKEDQKTVGGWRLALLTIICAFFIEIFVETKKFFHADTLSLLLLLQLAS